jgi:magnesium transporter
MAVNKTQIELLRKLLRHGAKERVIKTLEKFRPADLAEFFGYLNPIEQKQFIEILYTQERAAETLLELPQGILEEILSILDEDRVASLINRLAPDDGAFFTSLLDDDRIDAILGKVEENRRIRIDHLRTYPAESAGSLMSADMLTVREDMTVEQAIQAIRERAAESEFIFYVYVVNESKTFLGVVPIRRLIAAQPEATLSEIMVTNPVAVKAMDDQEVVVELTARYNLLAVPVVDEKFTLLGVITVDDVIDVLTAEATEDMYRMQLLSEEDRVYSPVSRSIARRFPWMVLNLGTAFLASSVVGLFERSIAEVVVLATFMPVVAGMGGNAGTQTLTVVTRAIALGELEYSQGMHAIGKQLVISLTVGAGIGVIAGLTAWLWKGSPVLGLVLFSAMVINMTIAGLAGAAVPIMLKALNQDPALGGGVVVTTFTDIFGFLAFLGLATAFISYF